MQQLSVEPDEVNFDQTRYEAMMSRQERMVGDTSRTNMLIIGSGGIGSNVADLFISMGGRKLTLVDHDVVRPENEFPGNFNTAFIDKPKVDSVFVDLLTRYSHSDDLTVRPLNVNLFDMDIRETLGDEFFDIILVCTDTIESRRYAFEQLSTSTDLWIDARMGGPSATVFAFMTSDIEQAQFYLDMDLREVTDPLPCGLKATAFLTGGFIKGMVGVALRDYSLGKTPPYQQVLDAELMKWVVAGSVTPQQEQIEEASSPVRITS